MRNRERIVVTGFRSFPGVPDNPTQRLVERLAQTPRLLPAGAEFRLLDTTFAAIPPALEDILSHPPAALVMTGYSALARGLTLERRASDLCSPDFADAVGYRPASTGRMAIDLRANPACDFLAIEAALLSEGLACRLSDDAGQYVCNHAYHAALSRIAEGKLGTRAIFVHVPALAGSPLSETSAASMSLDEMARGVALIARMLAL